MVGSTQNDEKLNQNLRSLIERYAPIVDRANLLTNSSNAVR